MIKSDVNGVVLHNWWCDKSVNRKINLKMKRNLKMKNKSENKSIIFSFLAKLSQELMLEVAISCWNLKLNFAVNVMSDFAV